MFGQQPLVMSQRAQMPLILNVMVSPARPLRPLDFQIRRRDIKFRQEVA